MLVKKEVNPMLTTNEVARFLNVHINTVRRWSNAGILRAYRIGTRGDRRFERMDVQRLLTERLAYLSKTPPRVSVDNFSSGSK